MAATDVTSMAVEGSSPENLTSELGPTITTPKVLLDSCPIWTDPDRDLLHSFSFWVEGVCQGSFEHCNHQYYLRTPAACAERECQYCFSLIPPVCVRFQSLIQSPNQLEIVEKLPCALHAKKCLPHRCSPSSPSQASLETLLHASF